MLTCLVAKACDPDIDPRFHRKPSAEMPNPPSGNDNWFSGRSISERIIYPWMTAKGYRTAKSGWQTRTFERPRPYTLDYPENIAHVKSEFLSILDKVASQSEAAEDVLVYFFVLEEDDKRNREQLAAKLAKQTVSDDVLIVDIIDALNEHFTLRNSARLPVIAVFAIYKLLVRDVKSYTTLSLLSLSAHEASDLRTGAIGDIELADSDETVVEALEIKHRIQIDETILLRAEEKIRSSEVARYYLLTTHPNCNLSSNAQRAIVKRIYAEHGCQVIINGVLPTIKYYLRLVSNPEQFLVEYTGLLTNDAATRESHLTSWNTIFERFSTQS